MWILKIVDMKKNSSNHKGMEEFYNHSGIDDQELQLLSENVKTLSTQVASMERSINNPDFVRKILDQQKEADNKAIMVNMRNAANSIHLICPAPRVTIPKEDLDPLRDFNANYSKITHRPLFGDRPRKWLWFLVLFVLVLEVAFGTFLMYERRWSPYGWGIRAHEAAVKLGIPQQKDAFWSTVESIRSGSNKKQAQGRVLDWEKKTRDHGKTKVPE